MDYDAITIDTNILRHNGYKFSSGILAQLRQFKNAGSKLILSRVVVDEVRRHLTEEIVEVRQRHNDALGNLNRKNAISEGASTAIHDLIKAEASPQEIVDSVLGDFIESTGGILIDASLVDSNKILDLYFGIEPPFEKKADKKHEFPDAIALMSLEKWAEDNDKRILAVSDDGGWIEYAKKSDRIDIEKDLAVALETLLIDDEEAVRALVQKALKRIEDDHGSPDYILIEQKLKDDVQEIDAYGEACSSFALAEPGDLEAKYKSFSFWNFSDEYDFHILKHEADEVVIQIAITVNAEISCDFDLSAWDGIDREYVGITTTTSTIEEEFEASLLITFSTNIREGGCEVIHAELTDTPNSFDFGEVEPDHSFYE